MRKEIEKLLQSVQKPARYAGGELNSVMKDKSKVALRYAFCFPDTYEIGMSHLGMKILYGVANAREDTWCERVFAGRYGGADARQRRTVVCPGKRRSDQGL